MTYQTDERARVRRQRTEQAIAFAMESKWEEAASVNRALLAQFPTDVDAYNRLGKALTELGQYSEAHAAYSHSLELDAANSIARKNLTRLSALVASGPRPIEAQQKVDPDLFIEETGKTGVTELQRVDPVALQRMAAGDLVLLTEREGQLQVTDAAGTYLASIDPRIGLRLMNLIKTGNQYAAAIAGVSASGQAGRIIIKETLQSPENEGKLSFPPTKQDGHRPDTRSSLIRYELDDDDSDSDEREGSDDWDGNEETEESGDVSFEFKRGAERTADDDENYEE